MNEDSVRTLPHDPSTTGTAIPRLPTEMEKQTNELKRIELHARYGSGALLMIAVVVVPWSLAGLCGGLALAAWLAFG